MQKTEKIFATLILSLILLPFLCLVRLPQIKINFEITIDQQDLFDFVIDKYGFPGGPGYESELMLPPPTPIPTVPHSYQATEPTTVSTPCPEPTPDKFCPEPTSIPTSNNYSNVPTPDSFQCEIVPWHIENVILHNEKSKCNNNKIFADYGTFSKDMESIIKSEGFQICREQLSEYFAVRENIAGSDMVSIYSSTTGDLIFFSAYSLPTTSRDELIAVLNHM